jgi:hypothetical protein
MSKRIVGLVVLIWSLLLIVWASVLVYNLSSPDGPIMSKRDRLPLPKQYEAVPARVIVSKSRGRAALVICWPRTNMTRAST